LKQQRFRYTYPVLSAFGLLMIAVGFITEPAAKVFAGLKTIVTVNDVLITDYMEIASPGAAFVNAGIVTLISILVLYLSRDPVNGFTIATVGLMCAFSFFGKNAVNMWPILAGTWLYSVYRREPFKKYVSVGLLATTLGPIVTFITVSDAHIGVRIGGAVLIGLFIGFVVPPLASYTFTIQNGMNLYNVGFATGLLAMVIVAVMISFGADISPVLYWKTGLNIPISAGIAAVCVILISVGSTRKGAWHSYRRLLKTTGRAPSDYLRMFGAGPVLINTGLNGLLALGSLLIIGGDLNGPTLGGIITVMCFSAFGKHLFNIGPVMLGVMLGGLIKQWDPAMPQAQLALLFCTTLAPISGYFGWEYGIAAGFLHSSVALRAGLTVEGLNLYNNGFSGGLIAITMYPIVMGAAKKLKPKLQNKEYYDTMAYNDSLPVQDETVDNGGEK